MARGRRGIVTEALVGAAREFGESDGEVLLRCFPWAGAIRPIRGGWKLYEDIDDALDEAGLLESMEARAR